MSRSVGAAKCRNFWNLSLVLVMACCLGGAFSVQADQPGPSVKFTPEMTLSSLAARSDNDLLELSDGNRIRLGELRSIELMASKLRTAPAVAVVPDPLRGKAASTGMGLNSAASLAAMLKLSDSETVLLPSGLAATVGQVRFVQPRVEMRLGHALGANRPRLDGLALKVGNRTDWQRILNSPDATVLVSPSGIGVTVGELKQAIKTSLAPPPPPAKPTAPLVRPRKRKG